MTTTPMTKAQWLEAMTGEGLVVVEQGDWWNRERDDETGKAFGPVNGVVIHHTAGVNSLNVVVNGVSGLPGPLCHGYMPKSGKIHMISGGRANHAGTFAQNAWNAVLAESPVHPYPDSAEPIDANDHTYGLEIENLGNGEDPYPLEQYQAAVKWATAICRFHGWTEHSVIGHKEGTRRKIDPKGPVAGGPLFTMDRFRADVRAALALPAGVWPNQEEDMALSAEDIDKVADRVVAKLFAADVVPATAPPINNADWDSNKTWTFKYASHAAVLAGRQAVAAVEALEAKVDALSTGGVDVQALAAAVVAKFSEELSD